MTAFKSYRVAHEYSQTNPATPDKVFPLLCPVREGDWLPGWQHRLINSDSGIAELGCVFTTPNPPAADHQTSETTWIVTEYNPSDFRIVFLWINPGVIVCEIRIELAAGELGTTRAHIRYRYTGLSPEGNRVLEGYDQNWFEAKMQNWETMMNHYLRTSTKLSA